MGFTPITLPVSKEVVLIQPVSPFLLNKLKRRYPPPTPPVERVNMGTPDEPFWQEQVNEAHPDYLAARQAWSGEQEERTRRFTIKLGALIEWTDAKIARLAEIRKKMEELGEPLDADDDKDDNYAYISYVAVQSGEDYKALLEAIINGSRPSEEAITEAVATFRPDANGQRADLQGAEHIR